MGVQAEVVNSGRGKVSEYISLFERMSATMKKIRRQERQISRSGLTIIKAVIVHQEKRNELLPKNEVQEHEERIPEAADSTRKLQEANVEMKMALSRQKEKIKKMRKSYQRLERANLEFAKWADEKTVELRKENLALIEENNELTQKCDSLESLLEEREESIRNLQKNSDDDAQVNLNVFFFF